MKTLFSSPPSPPIYTPSCYFRSLWLMWRVAFSMANPSPLLNDRLILTDHVFFHLRRYLTTRSQSLRIFHGKINKRQDLPFSNKVLGRRDQRHMAWKWLYVMPRFSLCPSFHKPLSWSISRHFWLSVDAGSIKRSHHWLQSVLTAHRRPSFLLQGAACSLAKSATWNWIQSHIIVQSPCCHLKHSCLSAQHGALGSPFPELWENSWWICRGIEGMYTGKYAKWPVKRSLKWRTPTLPLTHF